MLWHLVLLLLYMAYRRFYCCNNNNNNNNNNKVNKNKQEITESVFFLVSLTYICSRCCLSCSVSIVREKYIYPLSVRVNSPGKLTLGKLATQAKWLATLQDLLHA